MAEGSSFLETTLTTEPPTPLRAVAMDSDPMRWPLRDRPLIYVAGFYTANPTHGLANAAYWAERLLQAGWLPFVPHVSLMLDALTPREPDYWYEYDLGLLQRCDAMFVCPDPRSAVSTGVGLETAFASEHDIPIFREVIQAKDRYER